MTDKNQNMCKHYLPGYQALDLRKRMISQPLPKTLAKNANTQ